MSRSISEFRSALAALTGPTAPVRAVANPRGVRARRNMAIRWGGAEFDTWDEVPEPIKRQILAGQTAAAPAAPRPKAKKVAPAPFTRDLGQAAEEGIIHRIGQGPMYEPGSTASRIFMQPAPAEPVRPARQPRAERGERKKATSKQYQDVYAKLAASVGGARHLCPGVDWSATKAQAEATGSTQYAVIFRSMGLDDAGAIAVAQAMDRAGVLSRGTGSYGTTEAQQEQARKILFAVSGIACPVQGKKNPIDRRELLRQQAKVREAFAGEPEGTTELRQRAFNATTALHAAREHERKVLADPRSDAYARGSAARRVEDAEQERAEASEALTELLGTAKKPRAPRFSYNKRTPAKKLPHSAEPDGFTRDGRPIFVGRRYLDRSVDDLFTPLSKKPKSKKNPRRRW